MPPWGPPGGGAPWGILLALLAVRESADCENRVFKNASVALDAVSSDVAEAVLLVPIDAIRLFSSDSALLTMAFELAAIAPAPGGWP